jgi:hypothetical protein
MNEELMGNFKNFFAQTFKVTGLEVISHLSSLNMHESSNTQNNIHLEIKSFALGHCDCHLLCLL